MARTQEEVETYYICWKLLTSKLENIVQILAVFWALYLICSCVFVQSGWQF